MNEGLRESLRAGAQLALAGLAAAALLAGTWALTRERIADAEQRAKLQALEIVLPAKRYDNDPIADAVQVRGPGGRGPPGAPRKPPPPPNPPPKQPPP
ncbi:MAG: hypothetical protein K0M64_05965, partial [Rhizobium sp.]|nr:hypothetical protein [Rhizobium sp.]